MSVKTAIGRCGFLKFVTVIATAGMVAACSSASTRFGPYNQQSAAKTDPGYPQGKTTSSTYTGAIRSQHANRPYNRAVESAPLDTPVRGASVRSDSIVVRRGDTLYSLSRNHGVKVRDLIARNDLQPPYDLAVGQRLILPGRNYVRKSAPRYTASHKPLARRVTSRRYVVKPGETLYRISVNHGMKAQRVAAYNNILSPYAIKPGQVLRLPGAQNIASARPSYRDRQRQAMAITPRTSNARPSAASVSSKANNNVRTSAIRRPVHKGPLPTPEALSSAKFRWPVKGRIISRYGAKQNGGRNDGINLAVPLGTSVKSAENGVVAYSGNELRGYGNLVLVRHADGWVTAYAHNSRIYVQRGDRVKRGQIIAKAGQSGSVTSPQLHFEIRKGAKAVDPVRLLSPTNVATR